MNNEPVEPFAIPEPQVRPLQTADVAAPLGETSGTVSRTYSVRQPEEDVDEFMVNVRASTLNRCRNYISQITTTGFPWSELFLAVASLFLGAWLGAIPSEIAPNTPKYLVYYQVCPVIGFSCLVAYLFLRHQSVTSATSLAKAAIDQLPDPHRAK